MRIISGVYAFAKVFTDNMDDYAAAQLELLCNHEISKNSKIRIMPDVHPGKVGTIGLTMTIQDKIIPNLLGNDIGCGLTCYRIKAKRIEGKQLDAVIREQIPVGFSIRKKHHRYSENLDLNGLKCARHINEKKVRASLGTLGGGNHFLEVDKDEAGQFYLIVHTGSRHLGVEVTEYYQNQAHETCKKKGIPYPVSYLDGEIMEDYLHDLQIVQEYAALNRICILDEICKGMKWKVQNEFECMHNYVEMLPDGQKILRKGAISAKSGETLFVPINMKDGVLLGTGKGNLEWNYSAPHGSGRIYRRDQVKEHYTVSDFKKSMEGIYCSCIGKETLDESPFAYRGIETIRAAVGDTMEIQKVLRPVYNFKAGGK